MRNPLLILPLLFLTSCGSLSNLSEGMSKGREMLGEIQRTYDELKPSIDIAIDTTMKLIVEGKQIADEIKAMSAEAKKNADKDGDGELSLMERLAYIITLVGGLAEYARRKMKGTQESVALLHARIDRERTKRKANEATAS